MKGVLRRILISGLLIALLVAGPAAGATIVGTLNLVPGKLVVKSATAVASPSAAVQVPVTIADGRGNGKGWTLKVASGRSITVTGITARCASNSTCTLPTAAQGPAGSIVLKAAPDSGMGVVNLVVTVAPLPAGSAPAALSFTAA